jgi:mRNA interferase MazF
LCQVTSNPYGDPAAILLDAADFASGSLSTASYARPGKLFTAHAALFVRSVGLLHPAALDRIVGRVVTLLRPGTP